MKTPYDLESEKAIIGTMLMSGESNDKIAEVIKHGCCPELFFNQILKDLFIHITDLYRDDKFIDKMQFKTFVYNDPSQKFGTIDLIVECEGLDLVSSRIENAVLSLISYYDRRKVINHAQDLLTRSLNVNESVPDLMNTMREGLDQVGKITVDDSDSASIKDAFNGLRDLWAEAKQNGGMRGIPVGIPQLDSQIRGLGKGDLVCFSGLPSQGKSVLILQAAATTIVNGGKVLIFSMEMQREEVLARLIANIAGIDMGVALTGYGATKSDLLKMKSAAEKMELADVHIYDQGDMTINWIEAKCVQQQINGDVDGVFLDYWQLIESPEHKEELKRLNYTSRRLKTLAKVLRCPVVTGSQLNQDGKTKDSKAMIADANILIRIQSGDDGGLIVDKSRNTARGQFIPCRLNGNNQRFQ